VIFQAAALILLVRYRDRVMGNQSLFSLSVDDS
jgi:hypothetical protein